MGYRSEVAYVIRFENIDTLNAFKVSTLFEDKAMRDALSECDTDEKRCFIRFFADAVKWYDSYDDVQSHERLMSAACEEPFNAGVRFVRIGEDYDDTEVRDVGNDTLDAWEYLGVHRAIEFN